MLAHGEIYDVKIYPQEAVQVHQKLYFFGENLQLVKYVLIIEFPLWL